MEFITAYGPKLRVFAREGNDGRTKQAFREESEIKNILAKFRATGLLEFQEKAHSYGEFEAIDFHEAMNIVVKAEEMFAELPSDLRKKLGNDPAEMVALVTDPARRGEAEALGLIMPEPPAPMVPPVEPGGTTPPVPPAAPQAGPA